MGTQEPSSEKPTHATNRTKGTSYFRPVGTSVELDKEQKIVTIKGPSNPVTPQQAYVFALDILGTLHPVITAGQNA